VNAYRISRQQSPDTRSLEPSGGHLTTRARPRSHRPVARSRDRTSPPSVSGRAPRSCRQSSVTDFRRSQPSSPPHDRRQERLPSPRRAKRRRALSRRASPPTDGPSRSQHGSPVRHLARITRSGADPPPVAVGAIPDTCRCIPVSNLTYFCHGRWATLGNAELDFRRFPGPKLTGVSQFHSNFGLFHSSLTHDKRFARLH
jgi:hypothetical protein